MALASTKSNIPKSFTKALEQIKAKGFSHIKVELEGVLGRTGRDESCNDCSTRGWIPCDTCHNSGFIRQKDTAIECSNCNGDGHSECRRCNGRGYTRGGWTDSYCRDFILKTIKRASANKIVFGEFYYDGSVDSEYTFTIATEHADVVLEVMGAFNKLGNKIGNGVRTHNAGLHIAVLPDGVYPCKAGLLNQKLMLNFRTEVAKLLPALYFLGTHTGKTRDLNYRKPFVSNSEKYSAIFTHGDTAIEYRLFDPCFDKPEAFYDKVEVIAQTLKYYSEAKVRTSYNSFKLYELPELSALYNTLGNYDALLKTISAVKPNKTISALKEERGITINKTLIRKAERDGRKGYLENRLKAYENRLEQYQENIRTHASWLRGMLQEEPGRRDYSVMSAVVSSGIPESEFVNSAAVREAFVTQHPELFGIFRPPLPPSSPETYDSTQSLPHASYTLTSVAPLDEESDEYEE